MTLVYVKNARPRPVGVPPASLAFVVRAHAFTMEMERASEGPPVPRGKGQRRSKGVVLRSRTTHYWQDPYASLVDAAMGL
jgi:hypothetical protein